MTFDTLLTLVRSEKAPPIRTDSRLVRDGDIFIAIKGTAYDGHEFIEQAIANGAGYIVCEHHLQKTTTDTSVEFITVEDTSKAVAILAQAAKGDPASHLTNLAVTGTNGKTTVAFLTRSCIQQTGHKCGLIGTVVYDTCSGNSHQASLTTPDGLDIAEKQHEMVKNGATFMVTEASSHALSQNRLAGIDFTAAAFTNLTGDHLDYHKTKQDYLAAKTRLFSSLAPDATAVLNKQSGESKHIASKTKAKLLWYAIDEESDLTAHIESMDINGTTFMMEYAGRKQKAKTTLPGLYNVSNCLAAAGLCLAAGLDLETIAAGLAALKVTPGRLERIDGGDFSVIIDYAHTDDALKNVLSTLKPLCKGKLRVVFGCGGDRDKTKRPRMAKVAEELADCVIVTSDNPRTENPDDIIRDIIPGFEKYSTPDDVKKERTTHDARRNTITIQPDRKQAIELAIESAVKDDIILIAGKGHEDYQIIGKQKFHFSDKEIAQRYLNKRAVGKIS
ncbi:MAG: UDP-N-acetylmuramoyl-L-alanyl-D-glutamate--2,6-diaminopimelate ligase [Sedimentisphaerales bacterium]|nr:UDP-N-acetylmuramoyl-L-alanyl-D-glutamate--2,6-diaminopimelate ligase [Sedimentisphaerales bacterium]